MDQTPVLTGFDQVWIWLCSIMVHSSTHFLASTCSWTIINLSFCNPCLATKYEWSVLTDTYRSDHVLVKLTFSDVLSCNDRLPRWFLWCCCNKISKSVDVIRKQTSFWSQHHLCVLSLTHWHHPVLNHKLSHYHCIYYNILDSVEPRISVVTWDIQLHQQ